MTMNPEYLEILHSFAPEIALVALALLVLAIDLVLPRGSARRWLTLLAVVGCLLVAGMAGIQWTRSAGAPLPPTVKQEVNAITRDGANALLGLVMGSPVKEGDKIYLPPEYIVRLLKYDARTRRFDWHLQGITETQALRLLTIWREGREIQTSGEAREMVLLYRALRTDFPELPARELGIGRPGLAAWWLFANDQYAAAFKFIFALAAGLVLLLSLGFPVSRSRGEFAGLLLFATLGLMVMVNSLDLVVLFLGLELAAICLYALAAWHKGDARSAEAGTKYLLLGSLASAFFIYGASLLFVKFGTTHLTVLAASVARPEPLVIIGLLMLLVGFSFKVAAAPLHLWAPDVYQGAPTAIAAFLSTASKAAGFAVLLRVLGTGFLTLSAQWVTLVGVMAALSMLVGNLVAIHQNSVKRLLAYSGIAQAGYLLIAIMAVGLASLRPDSGPQWGQTAIVLYLFLYTIANIGAFSITGLVEREAGSDEMSAFAGLRTRAPLLAFAMTLLLLSLGGIPLLSGFVGKWFLFLAGVQQGQYLLVILGAATSVVSIYYYLQIVKQIYILPAREGAAPIRTGALVGVGIFAVVLLTVAIGVYTAPFLDLAKTTAQSLLGR